ncbi:MAG: hypothetical protein CUN56_03350 [Phototrophicales bacterium]|nr:MAG: hypothetical protein CUN56_03350 [Phototrophicales bacterium]
MMRVLLLALLWLITSLTQAQTPTINLDTLPPCHFETDDDNIQVGAVIYNFETGTGCTQNLDVVFPVASVPKIFISAALLQRAAQGGFSLNQTLTFTEDYWMGGSSDCLNEFDLGRQITLNELNQEMIACSDNAATWMLMDFLGWNAVQFYADQQVDGIGDIVPYAVVDQRKLALIDSRWNDVPVAMASRYWRSRYTDGLDEYFTNIPRYSRNTLLQANADYFATYQTDNTATPRAIADFLIKQRDYYLNDFGYNGQAASGLFNTMMYTQRQYSVQAFPGTVYVGAKNGFDTGLVAEVNFGVHDLSGYNRTPQSIAIVFTRQINLNVPQVQQPRQSEGVLNRYLRDLSPIISAMLYPDAAVPEVTFNFTMNTVRLNTLEAIDACWWNYELSGFADSMVSDFELCLGQLAHQTSYALEDRLGVGLVLRGTNYNEQRVTLIFTLPDGSQRSYQTQRLGHNDVAFNWFHPVTMRGEWRVDIYINLQRVYTETVQVGL